MKRLFWSLLAIAALGFGVLPAAEDTELEFTKDGFIPFELLLRDTPESNLEISPNGRYLVGQRIEDLIEEKKYRIQTFSFDLKERQSRTLYSSDSMIYSGHLSYRKMARMFDDHLSGYGFSSSDSLIVGFSISGFYNVSPNGDNMEQLVSNLKNKTPINTHLCTSEILDYQLNDPDHILITTGILGDEVIDKLHNTDQLIINFMFIGGRHQKFFMKELGTTDRLNGVWRLNLKNRQTEQLLVDDRNTWSWWVDTNGEVALAESWPGLKQKTNGSFEDLYWRDKDARKLYLVKDNKFSDELPISLGPDKDDLIHQFSDPIFSTSGTSLYYLSQSQSDTVSLISMNLETKTTKVVKSDPHGDISSLIRDPYTNSLLGYKINQGKPRTVFFDKGLASIQKAVENAFPNDVPILIEWDRSFTKFSISVRSDIHPKKFYLFDRTTNSIEEIIDTAPWLKGYEFSRQQIIRIETRDGLSLEGFLTLPADKRMKAPYPTVLLIHGGPWQNDEWGFDVWTQFLANRGYAVLSVNFRGSSGYGTEFLNKGNKQWGSTMQNDLTDTVRWAIKEGISDKDKVAIMGQDYGGYAALQGLVSTPDLYQLGVSIDGIFDLPKRIEDHTRISGRFGNFTNQIMRDRIGNPETDRKKLISVSPVYHADKIQSPVLIVQRLGNWFVGDDQAFDMVRALRNNKKIHQKYYQKDPTKSTSFDRLEEETRLMQAVEDFLREHMPSDLMK